jgi:hypothetical protein
MQIDRSNYEIWLIDWFDRKLSEQEIVALTLFLKENPDLSEEFNELDKVSLNPPEVLFPNKKQLKKSISDLSGSQFELLCVAYLENDLSASQQTDLLESIDQNPGKKRIFELIQKTKLIPPGSGYRYKNRLIKRTIVQKVIRLSLIGLSAAAIVAMVMVTYILIPRKLSDEKNNTSLNVIPDKNPQQPAVNKLTDRIIAGNKIPSPGRKEELKNAGVKKNISVLTGSDSIILKNNESPENTSARETGVKKIPVLAQRDIIERNVSNILIASNSHFVSPSYDEERSNVGRFIAKNFREKILKVKIPEDSPLKGYEIAEAGVTGLNKLLGWEMALDKNNDENGELKSVYFSSKILKFNAPVKKTEPLP